MVKFSFLALAGALATASAAKQSRTIKLGNRQLRRGDASTEALLKKARPYKKAGAATRKLEQQENQIDGSYSIKFSQCVDIRTKDDELFNEQMISYVQAGSVVSTKSYVLFHVCQGNNCYYESDEDLYIVDLGTYLANVASYHANEKRDYCDACERFQDYCNPEQEVEEEAAEDEAAQEEGEPEDEEGEPEGGEEGDEPDRKLKKVSRRTANYIDCNKCAAYECYAEDNAEEGNANNNNNANANNLDEQVAEFIQQLAECRETGTQTDSGLNLYVGAMCSPYGDGVELAAFVDEECSMYTTLKSFNGAYNANYDANGINYVMYAENYIKYAFSEVMPCAEQEFDDPNEEQNGNNNAQEEEQRTSEYCEGLLNDGALDFNQCEINYDAEEQNDDGQYSFYTYDMQADQADNVEEVCSVVKKMDGEYYYAYDENASGTWYKRNYKGEIITSGSKSSKNSGGLSGGAIFGIIALILVVVGAGAFVMKKKKKASSGNATSADYQGGQLS